MPPPTVLDVYEARRRLGERLPKTPLLPSAWLSSIADGNVFLKIESVNLTNSFKIRGAMNAALRMSEGIDTQLPTIVTASAGNHGRALALAAEELGLPCVVFTPSTAPEAKQNAIRRHGAVLHSDCEDYDAAEKQASEFAEHACKACRIPVNRLLERRQPLPAVGRPAAGFDRDVHPAGIVHGFIALQKFTGPRGGLLPPEWAECATHFQVFRCIAYSFSAPARSVRSSPA